MSCANTSTYLTYTPSNYYDTSRDWTYPVWNTETKTMMDAQNLDTIDDNIHPLLYPHCTNQDYVNTAGFMIDRGGDYQRIIREVNRDLLEKEVPVVKRTQYVAQLLPLQMRIAENRRKRLGSRDDDVNSLAGSMSALARIRDPTDMRFSPPRGRPLAASDDIMSGLVDSMNRADMGMGQRPVRRRIDWDTPDLGPPSASPLYNRRRRGMSDGGGF